MKQLNVREILNGVDPPQPVEKEVEHHNISQVSVECSSAKNVYATVNDVIKASKLMKQKHHMSYRWYYCGECGYYHLTTRKSKTKKHFK